MSNNLKEYGCHFKSLTMTLDEPNYAIHQLGEMKGVYHKGCQKWWPFFVSF